MRSLFAALALAFLLCFAPAAQAQMSEAVAFTPSAHPVRFDIEVRVTADAALLMPDAALLAAVQADAALDRLGLNGNGRFSRMQARFRFADLEAFNAWYARPATQTMIARMREASDDENGFSYELNVQRPVR